MWECRRQMIMYRHAKRVDFKKGLRERIKYRKGLGVK